VRRGAAERRRSDGIVACWWGSSLACWRWPHRRAVIVAERRMRCPPQEHASASSSSSARRGGPDVRMPAVAWSPCPHPRSASTRPVLGVQCPRVRCPRVRCPMSGCPGVHCPGCPASVSARSASPSASVVSAPVTSWSASVDSHTARAMVWPPCRIRERLGQRLEPEPRPLRRRRPCWASDNVGWTWSSSWRRSGSGPGSIAWPARDRRLRRIARRSGSRYARCAPQAVAWRRTGRQGQGWRHEADHDLGWTAAATTSGARGGRPGPWVARFGRSLARRLRRACGPTAAQAVREHDRVGHVSPLSWENSGGPART
jgi:hypothetical protein